MALLTVAETPYYLGQAEKILSEYERKAIVDMISESPLCGVVIQGSGGVRKVRFAMQGRGKSGGARVIYFYYNVNAPVYLLDVFAKNEKANLTKAQVNVLKKLADGIKEQFKGGK